MLLETSLKENNRENEVVNWRRIKMKGKLVTPINNKGVSERAGYFIAKLETISETTRENTSPCNSESTWRTESFKMQ